MVAVPTQLWRFLTNSTQGVAYMGRSGRNNGKPCVSPGIKTAPDDLYQAIVPDAPASPLDTHYVGFHVHPGWINGWTPVQEAVGKAEISFLNIIRRNKCRAVIPPLKETA